VTPLNVLSLFAGIGGLDLGLERAGMRVVGQVEKDPFCQRVLARHWPEVPRHDDVRTAIDWWRSHRRPTVDVVAGGFPCQRWLWPAMADVIDALRPGWVVWENVPGLRTRGLSVVLADLDRLGYRCRVGEISACALGSPHPRRRLFGVAHAASFRCGQGRPGRPPREGPDRRDQPPQGMARPTRDAGPAGDGGWRAEPDVDRVAHGVPNGVDRRRALGNAVVPAVAELVGRLITTAQPGATSEERRTA